MAKYLFIIAAGITAPLLTHAQTIQTALTGILDLLNRYVLPVLLSLATLFFVYNAIRFFVLQSDSEEGRTKARQFLLYSILAFAIITALWGIVYFVIAGLGFVPAKYPVVDKYYGDRGFDLWAPEAGE